MFQLLFADDVLRHAFDVLSTFFRCSFYVLSTCFCLYRSVFTCASLIHVEAVLIVKQHAYFYCSFYLRLKLYRAENVLVAFQSRSSRAPFVRAHCIEMRDVMGVRMCTLSELHVHVTTGMVPSSFVIEYRPRSSHTTLRYISSRAAVACHRV